MSRQQTIHDIFGKLKNTHIKFNICRSTNLQLHIFFTVLSKRRKPPFTYSNSCTAQLTISLPTCSCLYSYEVEFIRYLFSAWQKQLPSQFDFTYRCIDDVLSINDPYFEHYLGQIYPTKLEMKDEEQRFCFLR